jgi:hypothetical protein
MNYSLAQNNQGSGATPARPLTFLSASSIFLAWRTEHSQLLVLKSLRVRMHLLNRETMVFRDQETSHDQKLKGYILHRRHLHLELCPTWRLGIQRRHSGCDYALAVAG